MPRVTEATRAVHRRRLLEAATAEFAAKGFDGARVDDISIAAGLGKGTIYNYFESKHEVFREAVAAWFARIVNTLEPLPADATIREQLLTILRTDLKVSAEIEEFARVVYRETLRPNRDEVAALLPDVDPSDEALEAVISRGQSAGEIRADRSAAELTRVLRSLFNGLIFERWMPDSAIELYDIPELAVDLFLQGVGT